jgi:hypothetical protein
MVHIVSVWPQLSSTRSYHDAVSHMLHTLQVYGRFCASFMLRLGGSHLLTLVPLSRDFSTLKMEAIRSSETSVHTRSTRRHIPEDGILHSHRRENLKSYVPKLVNRIYDSCDTVAYFFYACILLNVEFSRRNLLPQLGRMFHALHIICLRLWSSYTKLDFKLLCHGNAVQFYSFFSSSQKHRF